MPFPAIIKNIFNWISAHWMGILMYLLIFTLLADIFILIGSLINIVPRPISQNVIFYKGLIAIILTAGIVTYGIYNANRIKHVSYEIQLKNVVLNDINIVMISDSHLGAINNFEKNLERIVQDINDMNPDIVCIVGDIFNDDFNLIRNPDRAISLFRSINATYGVFAVLGNHDGGRTLSQMKEFLEASNITLLNDEHVIIDGRLALFGRLDANPIGGFGTLERQDITDTIVSVGADMPVIVMDHNPIHIKTYGNEVDLILAGHTHRGQMFPGNLITRAIFVADYGHYQKDENSPHAIVTSGVSTWGPPMRVGTNNEIVNVVLR
jgi:predicted MPP superfamily phosphohydrolase